MDYSNDFYESFDTTRSQSLRLENTYKDYIITETSLMNPQRLLRLRIVDQGELFLFPPSDQNIDNLIALINSSRVNYIVPAEVFTRLCCNIWGEIDSLPILRKRKNMGGLTRTVVSLSACLTDERGFRRKRSVVAIAR